MIFLKKFTIAFVLLAIFGTSEIEAQEKAPPQGLIVGTKEAPPFAMKTRDGTWMCCQRPSTASIMGLLCQLTVHCENPSIGFCSKRSVIRSGKIHFINIWEVKHRDSRIPRG